MFRTLRTFLRIRSACSYLTWSIVPGYSTWKYSTVHATWVASEASDHFSKHKNLHQKTKNDAFNEKVRTQNFFPRMSKTEQTLRLIRNLRTGLTSWRWIPGLRMQGRSSRTWRACCRSSGWRSKGPGVPGRRRSRCCRRCSPSGTASWRLKWQNLYRSFRMGLTES